MTFKDLQRLVQSQSGPGDNQILQRLRDKPFWLWDPTSHKQADRVHVQDKLPEEYQRCLTGMNQVLRLSWDIANKSKDGNGNDNGQTMTMTDDKTRRQMINKTAGIISHK